MNKEKIQREINKRAVKLSDADISPTNWIKPNMDVLENAIKREVQADPESSKLEVIVRFVDTDGTEWDPNQTPVEAD